jgi:hypothetical protein
MDLTSKALRSGDAAFVATFVERVSDVLHLTSNALEVEQALHQVLSAPAPPGGTAVYDAIHWACQAPSEARFGRNALIIMSDMIDNMSYHTRDEAIESAQRAGIVIFPIILGETSSRGWDVARSIAKDTGGLASASPNLEALQNLMGRIRFDLASLYLIAYRRNSNRSTSLKVICARPGVKVFAPKRRY